MKESSEFRVPSSAAATRPVRVLPIRVHSRHSRVLRFLCSLLLILSLVFAPCPRASAPLTVVEGGVAICVVLVTVSVGAVCLVRLCEPKPVLCQQRDEEGAMVCYVCTDQSPITYDRSGLRPCRGVYANWADCQADARLANAILLTNSSVTAFTCGPIAKRPVKRITAESRGTGNSELGTSQWSPAASVVASLDDNVRFAWVTPAQAGAMTAADWAALAGAAVVTNTAAGAQFFRFKVSDPDLTGGN